MSLLTENPTYYYGHGQLWLGTAVAGGMPATFDNDFAELTSMEITLSAEFIEHVSKRSSIAKKDLRVLRMISGQGKFVCSQHGATLLKKYLYASQTTIAGGAISATAFDNTAAVVGDILPLPGGKTKVSSLVITDSTGSPKTLTLGTNYEADVDAGVIKILDITTGGAFAQPFKAAFTEAAATANNIFQSTPSLQGMRFKGINLANGNAVEIVDLPKIQISPAASWGLLNDGNDVNSYEVGFEILEDASNSTYSFGRQKI
jgi:hypothetical protein